MEAVEALEDIERVEVMKEREGVEAIKRLRKFHISLQLVYILYDR